MSTGQIAVSLCFGAMVIGAVLSELAFDIWLGAKGVRYNFPQDHTIGFRSRAYIDLCLSQGRQPNRGFLILRAALILGVIPAAIAFAVVVI